MTSPCGLTVQKLFSNTAPVKVSFESAGRWFEALRLRRRHKHSLSHHSLQSSSSEESDNEEIEEEDNLTLLQGLDPKEWKVNLNYLLAMYPHNLL